MVVVTGKAVGGHPGSRGGPLYTSRAVAWFGTPERPRWASRIDCASRARETFAISSPAPRAIVAADASRIRSPRFAEGGWALDCSPPFPRSCSPLPSGLPPTSPARRPHRSCVPPAANECCLRARRGGLGQRWGRADAEGAAESPPGTKAGRSRSFGVARLSLSTSPSMLRSCCGTSAPRRRIIGHAGRLTSVPR